MNLQNRIVIPKGTEFHTIDSDGNYTTIDVPHYVSYLPEDIALYRREFPIEIHERYGDIPIYDVITKPKRDIWIASHEAGLSLFTGMLMEHRILQGQLQVVLDIFLNSFEHLNRILNEREAKVYSLLQESLGVHSSIEKLYDAFVVSMELDDPMFKQPYEQFAFQLMKYGYSGILDEADMHYNSYQAKQPLIILDPTCVKLIDIQEVKE